MLEAFMLKMLADYSKNSTSLYYENWELAFDNNFVENSIGVILLNIVTTTCRGNRQTALFEGNRN